MPKLIELSRSGVDLWEFQGRTGHAAPHGGEWSRADIVEAVTRVNRGALLLDNEKPGWEQEVVPGDLKMWNGGFCIIGQVYGEYDEYVGVPFGMGDRAEAFGDSPDYWDETYTEQVAQQAIDHGFLTQCHTEAAESGTVPYALLDIVWVAMLTLRQEEGGPVELRVPEEDSWDDALARLLKEELVTREQVKELATV